MTPVMLEPMALRSRVKHSTTEPPTGMFDLIHLSNVNYQLSNITLYRYTTLIPAQKKACGDAIYKNSKSCVKQPLENRQNKGLNDKW